MQVIRADNPCRATALPVLIRANANIRSTRRLRLPLNSGVSCTKQSVCMKKGKAIGQTLVE